jgi:ribonuclease E
VIVHHDPVAKHRQSPQPPTERRRSKNGAAPATNGQTAGATHAITENAKNALAQIAASTIVHGAADGDKQQSSDDLPGASEGVEAHGTEVEIPESDEPTVELIIELPEPAPTDVVEAEPVAILDIPVSKAPQTKPRLKSREAEQLLDSVLDALPEPKQPGQGRNRNRRVTTASLSGGTSVTPDQH